MRQTISLVLVIIVALVAGVLAGRFLLGDGQSEAMAELRQQVQDLGQQVGELEARAGEASGDRQGKSLTSQNIAVVGVNELATRYQEQNPDVKERLTQEVQRLQGELSGLQESLRQGEISQEEFTLKATQLQQQLDDLLSSAVARPLQAAVTAVAQRKGYDIVLKQQDVVIYHRDGVMDNITEEVWDLLQSQTGE